MIAQSIFQKLIGIPNYISLEPAPPDKKRGNIFTVDPKTTVPGIPAWSPTAVLTWRYHA
jgi:hypothetical protein